MAATLEIETDVLIILHLTRNMLHVLFSGPTPDQRGPLAPPDRYQVIAPVPAAGRHDGGFLHLKPATISWSSWRKLWGRTFGPCQSFVCCGCAAELQMAYEQLYFH